MSGTKKQQKTLIRKLLKEARSDFPHLVIPDFPEISSQNSRSGTSSGTNGTDYLEGGRTSSGAARQDLSSGLRSTTDAPRPRQEPKELGGSLRHPQPHVVFPPAGRGPARLKRNGSGTRRGDRRGHRDHQRGQGQAQNHALPAGRRVELASDEPPADPRDC